MNAKSLIWGIIGTVIWLLTIFLFAVLKGYELPNSLNELGDALAGIVAPIAFFWLILGYVQQGKQLEQNTKALEQQEKALNLQIAEMKESVQQQKELVVQQKEQNDRRIVEVKPYLRFHSRMKEESLKYGNYRNLDTISIVLSLTNAGVGSARDISLSSLNGNNESFRDNRVKIDSNENAKLSFAFSKEEKNFFEEHRSCEIKFRCTYKCIYEKEYRENFTLIIKESFNSKVQRWVVNTQLKI